MRFPPVLSIALTAVGCSSGLDPEDVRIGTDRPSYVVPDVAIVSVRNDSDQNIYFSSCAILQHHDGRKWVEPAEVDCPADLNVLGPGESYQFLGPINPGARLGTARFRTPISSSGTPFQPDEESFVTNQFTVVSDPPLD